MVLTVFLLSIFALIGLQLYRGTLLRKCVRAWPSVHGINYSHRTGSSIHSAPTLIHFTVSNMTSGQSAYLNDGLYPDPSDPNNVSLRALPFRMSPFHNESDSAYEIETNLTRLAEVSRKILLSANESSLNNGHTMSRKMRSYLQKDLINDSLFINRPLDAADTASKWRAYIEGNMVVGHRIKPPNNVTASISGQNANVHKEDLSLINPKLDEKGAEKSKISRNMSISDWLAWARMSRNWTSALLSEWARLPGKAQWQVISAYYEDPGEKFFDSSSLSHKYVIYHSDIVQ
ncbi:unnamed protein product [Protopolystoma xenopodis]|uniref:Uncharacterized protein n=1 Tax=Protopolystoma xenopodis TaxID=117903 RepID=A0A448WL43_9PLAT|nr:unnamed protein product [Protopolystoma xenopodis]